jgi:glycosyltransferase involved in cell wall biosynthesis
VDRFGWTARAARAAALAGPIWATRPDVVHVGFSGIAVVLADVWDLLDVPIVISCRGTDELVRPALDPTLRPELDRVFARATTVHAVAGAVAQAVVDLGADPERVRVVRPAVDVDRWSGEPAPLYGPPWRLVSVTRFVPAKGADDLVSALAAVRAAGVEASLRLVGEGPHLDAVRLRVQRTGLDDAVTFVGTCSPAEVGEELRRAHLYVSPSLSEGISNGVLEAMASGVAVVSTDVGGMGEAITDEVDGWLVPPARPDLLADAIGRALADPDRLAAVAAAGRARVVAGFSRPDQAAAWLAIYRDLGGAGTPARVRAPGEDRTP